MAAVLNTLDKFYKSGTPTSPVLASATKHGDGIFVSRYYNWRPGTYKNVYTRVGMYKLKSDVPEHALETLSKGFIVPLLEKLLADGSIVEYEIDTEAIHTEAPGTFWIDVITTNADGLDKLNAALMGASKAGPMNVAAFESMVDSVSHRDNLSILDRNLQVVAPVSACGGWVLMPAAAPVLDLPNSDLEGKRSRR